MTHDFSEMEHVDDMSSSKKSQDRPTLSRACCSMLGSSMEDLSWHQNHSLQCTGTEHRGCSSNTDSIAKTLQCAGLTGWLWDCCLGDLHFPILIETSVVVFRRSLRHHQSRGFSD